MHLYSLRRRLFTLIVTALLLISVCFQAVGSTSGQLADLATQAYLPLISHQPLRIAVIGDYGLVSQETRDVATLVSSWQPDLVLTTGDNNYPVGSAETIDHHIGAYYHEFIAPYYGQYGAGSSHNRFFPTLGNHDWASGAQPYLDYFTLPGNERYYDVQIEQIHLFAIDSDPHEPDGVEATSIQGAWLKQGLAASSACWKLVYMHHAPFSSGAHGSNVWMQWPYREWGANAVLAGHDHTYERILIDDMPYFVNGLGGHRRYTFGPPVAGSQLRYSDDVGAMLIEVVGSEMIFSFITRAGQVIDTYRLPKNCPAVP